MSKKNLPRTVYIDAISLVPKEKSGVGFTLEQTLKNLSFHTPDGQPYDVCLVVPLGKEKHLKKYVKAGITIKTLYLPARVMEVPLRLGVLPPVDWFAGKGLYVFPNYRNWPVWRSRSLTYIYDIGFLRFPETVQPKNQRYLKKYIRRWLARTDYALTISNQVKYEIEKYLNVPESVLKMIYCGVERKVFYRRSIKEVQAAKAKYGIEFERYFLFVGNIEPRKNLVKLLEAYRDLPASIRDSYGLVFVGGEGWLNQEFYQKLAEVQDAGLSVLKVAKYVGTQDLPALYSGAAALVHPAVYEGFGITPLEAMACETPVVVSDIPAVREVVHAAGYYFDPNDAVSIMEAMREAVTDTAGRDRYKHEGLGRAEVLSWQETARNLELAIEAGFSLGPQKHPMLKRLKLWYVSFDIKFRQLLGEKAYDPYVPAEAASKQELARIIEQDFEKEEPNALQLFFFGVYQGAKHLAAKPLKLVYRRVRR